MIDHFEIKTVHFASCRDFYATVLAPLAIELKWDDDAGAGFGTADDDKVRFVIEKLSTGGDRVRHRSDASVPAHIAFTAKDEASVQRFYAIGIEHGYVGNGEPGLRTHYAPDYYAAFLLDPDGNNVEAVVRA